MKKFLPIFFSLALLATQSQASNGVFIGIDGLETIANHKSANSAVLSGPKDNNERQTIDTGFGLNAGVRYDPAILHFAGEVFYEDLNSTTKGFDNNIVGTGPKIQIDNRYGARANLGIKVLPGFSPFVSWGVARTQYQIDGAFSHTSPVYGVGFLFDLPKTNLSIKTSYDIQKLNKLPYQNATSDTILGVAHLGLSYTFGSAQ